MKKPDKDAGPGVDAMLAAARAQPLAVPDALMARVLADAARLQPKQGAQTRHRPGIWLRISALFGGWQGIGGLVAATCAGVWIGWNPPAALPDAGALILGYDSAAAMGTQAELTSYGWDVDGG